MRSGKGLLPRQWEAGWKRQPLRPGLSVPHSSKHKERDLAVTFPCPSTPAVSRGARGPGELGNGQRAASTPALCPPCARDQTKRQKALNVLSQDPDLCGVGPQGSDTGCDQRMRKASGGRAGTEPGKQDCTRCIWCI